MAVDDALNGRQADSGTFKLLRPMQALKDAKQLIDILHVKSDTVVPYEDLNVAFVSAQSAYFDIRLAS
jgi:hypothetical protein